MKKAKHQKLENFGLMFLSRLSKIQAPHIISIMAVLTLPVALFAYKALAILIVLAAVAVLVITFVRGGLPALPHRHLVMTLIGFSLLAVISASWSIAPIITLKKGLMFFVLVAVILVLVGEVRKMDNDGIKLVRTGLFFGGLLGYGLLAEELASGGAVTGLIYQFKGFDDPIISHLMIQLNPGAVVAAIFFWPWSREFFRRFPGILGIVIPAAVFLTFWRVEAQAPFVGLVCGGIVFLVSFLQARFAVVAFAITLAVGVGMAPLLVKQIPHPIADYEKVKSLSISSLHRLLIWHNANDLILERPWVGRGFDTTRSLYGKADKNFVVFGIDANGKEIRNYFEPIPLHTHNGVIQIWLELGALGGFFLLTFLMVLLRGIAIQKEPRYLAPALATLASAVVLYSLSFGAWQSWWLSALSIIGVLAACTLANRKV